MKGIKIYRKSFSLLMGVMLLSILFYGIFHINTTPSQAVPPRVTPTVTPTPTPTPTRSPSPPPRPTPTPTIVPPPIGGVLEVVTIPQEDQLRKKGIMILCPENSQSNGNFCRNSKEDFDPHAEYKIHFVDPDGNNVDPVSITCTVIQKDVCHVPEEQDKATGRRQTDPEIMEAREFEATDLFNVSNFFVCKYRSVKEGVGVLEVYYTGSQSVAFIGDHILKVEAEDARGNIGAEIQDICILGFPTCGGFHDCRSTQKEPNFFFSVKWPDQKVMVKYADALWPFASCKNAALWQREKIGPPVTFCFTTDPFVGLSDP